MEKEKREEKRKRGILKKREGRKSSKKTHINGGNPATRCGSAVWQLPLKDTRCASSSTSPQ
jgi:hypothetical protein